MNEINKDRIIEDFSANLIRLGNECRDWAAECRMLSDKNKLLQTEVERLQNNCDYLDQKLDEEIEKSAMLCGQVESLMTNPTSRLLRYEREENARKIHGLQQDNEVLQNTVDRLEADKS